MICQNLCLSLQKEFKSAPFTMGKYNISELKEKEAVYRTLISPELMDQLERRINDLIIIQKKYRQKDYSAKKLATDLGTNTRYISAVINVRFHQNYTSFINSHRIREAMSLLVDKRYKDCNMEEIAEMVGFSNRQSFYAAFFRINQLTPRAYKLLHMAQRANSEAEMKTKGRNVQKIDLLQD